MNTPTLPNTALAPESTSGVQVENELPQASEVGRAVPSAPPPAEGSLANQTPSLARGAPGTARPAPEMEPGSTAANEATPGAQPLTCTAPIANLNQQAKRLQELIEKAESLPNPAARVLVRECLESVLAFYGDGLARVMEVVSDAEAKRRPVMDSLVHDPAVTGLLLIHGLHPLELETRLRAALEKVRPYMESHGGNVELLGLEDGHARLRLQGTCKTCSASTVTLELAVRSALQEACPDLAGFTVES